MTRYFAADDGHGEPTIWEHNPARPDYPEAILRRCDLRHTGREGLWPVIVAALDPDALRAEGWHAAQKASVAGPFPIRPEDCPWEGK